MAAEATKKKRPTALKRELQNEKKRVRNKSVKSRIHTSLRKLSTSLEKKEVEAAKEQLSFVYSLMDKAVKKGVFTLNKASRTKSRFSAKLAALS